MNIVNSLCPHCKKGNLIYVYANHPYNDEHLICKECDSTYNIEYNQLWLEDVQHIAGEMIDVLLDEFKERNIELDTKEEDKIFDSLVSIVSIYSTQRYKKEF